MHSQISRGWSCVERCCCSCRRDEPEEQGEEEEKKALQDSETRRPYCEYNVRFAAGTPIGLWFSRPPRDSGPEEQGEWAEVSPLLSKSAIIRLIRMQSAARVTVASKGSPLSPPCDHRASKSDSVPKEAGRSKGLSKTRARAFLSSTRRRSNSMSRAEGLKKASSPCSFPELSDFFNELNHTVHCLRYGLPIMPYPVVQPPPPPKERLSKRRDRLSPTSLSIPPVVSDSSSERSPPATPPLTFKVRNRSPFAIRSNRKVIRFPVAPKTADGSGTSRAKIFLSRLWLCFVLGFDVAYIPL